MMERNRKTRETRTNFNYISNNYYPVTSAIVINSTEGGSTTQLAVVNNRA